MQRISILITSSPESPSASLEAQAFCRSTLASGNAIDQIFFYQAGVYHANGLIDHADSVVARGWQTLNTEFNVPLLVCVGAASSRGIIDEEQAKQLGQTQHSLFAPFKQVGLGEFFTLLHDSDKLVQF
ncbi:sulfurtransferase complex subunit TusD [Alteromonas lipolytica]|uniref:Uncharacterized protein n=1 Tax=Alteromonas lipolytica TaxID=1856405 RepID=A0A1E8FHN0_9ALTE|nr:sulfurtransferase complex subunit TusD [Alteromonas lipolytica]OFI35246.1 hypothetical protein BFC17_17070 [Alteromonas lipolytica]GGF57957.1 hypothetical protein GCM10011338_07760 [Alteromonas lipolytica]